MSQKLQIPVLIFVYTFYFIETKEKRQNTIQSIRTFNQLFLFFIIIFIIIFLLLFSCYCLLYFLKEFPYFVYTFYFIETKEKRQTTETNWYSSGTLL